MALYPILNSPPASHKELVRLYELHVHESFARGEFEPIVFPYRAFGMFLILAYLLLPPSNSKLVYYAKYPVFAFFVYWSVKSIIEERSPITHLSYGVGLINTWSLMWVASLMIFNDAQRDFKRIARLRHRSKGEAIDGEEDVVAKRLDALSISSSVPLENGSLRARTGHDSTPPPNGSVTDPVYERKYAWQPLPSRLEERISWVADLVTSFRGAGWSHQILSIPGPPKHVLASLPKDTHPPSRSTVTEYKSIRLLVLSNWLRFLLCYMILDALKTFGMRDPYFWGYISSPPPACLPELITSSTFLTKIYRLVVSLTCIFASLHGIFTLNPIFYVGTPFRHVMGYRAEPWIYPDVFGHPEYLFTKGLTGWWGACWHQLFRFGFQAPGTFLIKKLGWEARSTKAKTLTTIVAFSCSGALHAVASYTTIPATNPLFPFLFFFLQGIGCIAETAFSRAFKAAGLHERTPAILKRTCALLWVCGWLLLTGPLLADDFARGGIWLFEPVPISPLRGLGFGLKEEGWWCWHRPLVWWHSADEWWKSGIAV